MGQAGLAFFFLRSFREGKTLHAAYRRQMPANSSRGMDSHAPLATAHKPEENTG